MMQNVEEVRAVAAAVAVHTNALRLDDDGRPEVVGLWHLLQSCLAYAEHHGVDLERVDKEVSAFLDLERPYLISVQDCGDATIPMPVTVTDYEVKASSIVDAVERWRKPDASSPRHTIRQTSDPYTGAYIPPDLSLYAGGVFLTNPQADDLPAAAMALREFHGFEINHIVPDGCHDDCWGDAVAAAELSFGCCARMMGSAVDAPEDRLRMILGATRAYADWMGVSYRETLNDCIEMRPEITGRFPDRGRGTDAFGWM